MDHFFLRFVNDWPAMGGAVSAGEDNDELVDHLVEADYIRSPDVESALRAVDRAHYYADGCKENAYRDLAWKQGNLHLSAPCIYSEVSQFLRSSQALEEYDFCEPCFVVGNCLSLETTGRRYDRVYCGASCPVEKVAILTALLKVGGVLVMPCNDQLVQVKRTAEDIWVEKNILPVSFASLVPPQKGCPEVVLPDYQPGSLQELSRGVIRRLLRARLDREKLPKPRRHLAPPRLRSSSSSNTVVPFRGTGSSTSTGGDSGSSSGDEPHRKRSAGGETSLLWKRAALDDVCPQAMQQDRPPLLCQRILELPLPPRLKTYLNFGRQL
ncbi:protein-L-isoaspartate O-methyltransferase domain-containing protein 1-like isoform X5 [Dermacentor andersoni]|uniref:protein-L-isoaspartate O-methyltransferase domain-containing protein 1-like isoform X5 n=1 Tax=Dermacentor andersoni TaxID=34620 RepID=UPI002416E4F2|nr:protein-L-isoaspartate O-methyltransferase domain-containing protein 1-like isoform X5 [Dermacentor andersoni]